MGWKLLKKKTDLLAVHAALLPIGPLGKVLILGGDEHDPHQAAPQGTGGSNKKAQLFDVLTGAITDLDGPDTDVFCCGHAFAGDGALIIGGGTKAWFFAEKEHAEGHERTDPEDFKAFQGESKCWRLPLRGPNALIWEPFGAFSVTQQGVHGRWYPGMFTLPDGRVIAVSGKPEEESLYNHIPEISDTDAEGNPIWKPLEVGNYHKYVVEYYPRCHLLPDGSLFFCAVKTENKRNESWHTLCLKLLETAEGSSWIYQKLCDFSPKTLYQKWYYASVLLPLVFGDAYEPRILICNDLEPRVIHPKTEEGFENSNNWEKTGNRSRKMERFLRNHANATLLPTGQVLVNGGVDATDQNELKVVFEAELYTPELNWAQKYYRTETGYWEDFKPEHTARVSRNYHSVALLLPDGSVWTAGSSVGGTSGHSKEHARKEIEIFYPDYFDQPDRLQIHGFGKDVLLLSGTEHESPIGIIYYGTKTFTLLVDHPEAVHGVALLRFGSCTHAGNFDQRYILTDFEITSEEAITVILDHEFDENFNEKVAPPGWYMVWVLNHRQIPCKTAKFILLTHK